MQLIKLMIESIYILAMFCLFVLKLPFNGIKQIPASRFNREKNELDISCQNKSLKKDTTIDEIIDEINQHHQLLSLNISGQLLEANDFLRIFQCLQQYQIIKCIDMGHNRLYRASKEQFAKLLQSISLCTSITHLNVAANGLDSDNACFLVDELINKCPSITYIGLSENCIDNKGAIALSKYPITINLKNNPVTKESMAFLATEYHQFIIGDPGEQNICRAQTKKISNPIELYNFWKRHGVEVETPSLFQLSLFKVKSTPALQEKAKKMLPSECQFQLHRHVIF